MTAHEIHALSGAYAVDALDDLERARFEDHLAACAECRAEVASLQDAAASFSSMTTAAPSADLRAKILADIKTVRPLPPVVARLDSRRPRRWANLVAAAAVLTVLGGGVTVWQQNHSTSQAPISAVDQIRTAADVTAVTQDLGKGAKATLYRSASLGKAALVTSHLPAAPNGKTYQLWLQNRAGHMVNAGLLDGSGNRAVVLQGDASDATAAGITVEPAGGSQTPSLPVVAVIEFEKAT
ncbi:anti-sigma factor [Nocardioides marmorisolisilvae]|uniref:Regulator of SigK n=1 Tax=Nocardioides marmorisolisilvae TaxID=1542737 RepID=A0A3N0DWF1_9ACTN|nr:anti-sigma factor [Nocardioides marmorisolisilvae]RNL79940.1 anti-sigma factor [Nocardioides marmorisolisilvae]